MKHEINEVAAGCIAEFEDPVSVRFVYDPNHEELEIHGDICSLLTSLCYIASKCIDDLDEDLDENDETGDCRSKEDICIAKYVCYSHTFMLLLSSAKAAGYPMDALLELIERIEGGQDD